MKRRNGIECNIYITKNPNHTKCTISSYIKQREKYVNESKHMTQMYLDIFRIDNHNFS
jgi:hypothetical protein